MNKLDIKKIRKKSATGERARKRAEKIKNESYMETRKKNVRSEVRSLKKQLLEEIEEQSNEGWNYATIDAHYFDREEEAVVSDATTNLYSYFERKGFELSTRHEQQVPGGYCHITVRW